MSNNETLLSGRRLATEEDFKELGDQLPLLKIERPINDCWTPKCLQNDLGSRRKRWKNMQKIYLLFPAPFQAYCVQQLRTAPHGQILLSELSVINRLVQEVNGDGRTPLAALEVVLIRENFKDAFLEVKSWHDLSAMTHLKPEASFRETLLAGLDKNRHHSCIDIGVCGWRNSSSRPEHSPSGVAKPNYHDETQSEFGQGLMRDMTQQIRATFPDRTLYSDPERQQHFGQLGEAIRTTVQKLATMAIPSKQWTAVTEQLLANHVDSDNEPNLDGHTEVVGFSIFTLQKAKHLQQVILHRQGWISYGKKAVGEFVQRYNLLKVPVDDMCRHYQSLPDCEKKVCLSLFPKEGQEHGNLLPNVHMVRTVYYTSFANVMWSLLDKYPHMKSNGWYLVALLLCTVTSHCPQHFCYEVGHFLVEPRFLDGGINLQPFVFCQRLWRHLHAVAYRNKPQICDYQPVGRFMPCNGGTFPTDVQIRNSMFAMARGFSEVCRIPAKELWVNRKFVKQSLNAHLAQSTGREEADLNAAQPKTGCIGLGLFTAQITVGVACTIGALPPFLMGEAEISPTTTTWKYLDETYKLLESAPQFNQAEVQSMLLAAASSRLRVSNMVSEEGFCRLCRSKNKSSKEGKYRDWIPNDVPIVFPTFPHRNTNPHKVELSLLFQDGLVKPAPKVKVNFQSLMQSSGVPLFPDRRTYWNMKFGSPLVARRSRASKIALQPEELFPLTPTVGIVKRESIGRSVMAAVRLPIPHPVKVLCSVPKSEGIAIVNPIFTLKKAFFGCDRFVPDDAVLRHKAVVIKKGGFIRPVMIDPRQGAAKRPKLDRATKKLMKQSRQVVPVTSHRIAELAEHVTEEKVMYHCCAVVLPDNGEVLWPDPVFPLREDYYQPEGKQSVSFDGCRWFRQKQAAIDFAFYHALFHRFDLFCECPEAVKIVQVEEDECIPLGGYETDKKEGEVSMVRWDGTECHYAEVQGTKRGGCLTSLKVMPKVGDRNSHFPHLVAVRYSKGGTGHYLCDKNGRVTSGIQLRLPECRTRRELDGDFSCCCLAILGHRTRRRRMEVHMAWSDGYSSWQSLSSIEKTAYWIVFHYADTHDLLAESPWKKFKSWGGIELPSMFIRGHHSERMSREALKVEQECLRQRQLVWELGSLA